MTVQLLKEQNKYDQIPSDIFRRLERILPLLKLVEEEIVSEETKILKAWTEPPPPRGQAGQCCPRAVAKCGSCSPARSPWEPSRSGISVGTTPPCCATRSWQALSIPTSSASISLTSIRFGFHTIHVYFVVFSSLLLPAMATRVSGASLSLRATSPEAAKVGRCSQWAGSGGRVPSFLGCLSLSSLYGARVHRARVGASPQAGPSGNSVASPPGSHSLPLPCHASIEPTLGPRTGLRFFAAGALPC